MYTLYIWFYQINFDESERTSNLNYNEYTNAMVSDDVNNNYAYNVTDNDFPKLAFANITQSKKKVKLNNLGDNANSFDLVNGIEYSGNSKNNFQCTKLITLNFLTF